MVRVYCLSSIFHWAFVILILLTKQYGSSISSCRYEIHKGPFSSQTEVCFSSVTCSKLTVNFLYSVSSNFSTRGAEDIWTGWTKHIGGHEDMSDSLVHFMCAFSLPGCHMHMSSKHRGVFIIKHFFPSREQYRGTVFIPYTKSRYASKAESRSYASLSACPHSTCSWKLTKIARNTVEPIPSATSYSPFSLGRVKLCSLPDPNILLENNSNLVRIHYYNIFL